MRKCPKKSEQTVKSTANHPQREEVAVLFFANFPFQTLTKASVVLYNEIVEQTTKNII